MENDYKGKTELRWIEQVTGLMDSKFNIPGTNFKFGLDPIIGLIPFIGDLSTFGVSAMMVYTMSKHGVSRKVIILMMLNIFLDTAIGSIPILGNVFDFFYKSNNRNLSLLKKHYAEGKYQGKGNGILIVIAISFVLILALIFYAVFKLFQFLFELF
jgi:hypothetical protein